MASSPQLGNPQTGAPPPQLSNDDELRELLRVLSAVRDGDFSVRVPGHWTGLVGKIADTVNDLVGANQAMAAQIERVGQVVGRGRSHATTRALRQQRRQVGRDGDVVQHAD